MCTSSGVFKGGGHHAMPPRRPEKKLRIDSRGISGDDSCDCRLLAPQTATTTRSPIPDCNSIHCSLTLVLSPTHTAPVSLSLHCWWNDGGALSASHPHPPTVPLTAPAACRCCEWDRLQLLDLCCCCCCLATHQMGRVGG